MFVVVYGEGLEFEVCVLVIENLLIFVIVIYIKMEEVSNSVFVVINGVDFVV